MAKVGKAWLRDELNEEIHVGLESNPEQASRSSALHRYGAKHTPLTHLLRKALWRKKYWNTPEFNQWLEEFNPECVFLSFSNDFFILEIALYIARKFDIPICSSTGDDYYFDGKFSLNPLYYIYHEWYKSLNRKVFRHKGSAIYIGDKIRDKYNNAFGLDGETVYLVSDIERREFRPINPEKFTVRYFGNIKMGRNTSICAIAEALFRINPKITIEVYSSESNPDYLKPFSLHKNIDFCGVIPYSQVMEKTVDSDILIVAEGTKAHDINLSRYALSTKVADALASGCNIVAYGSMECGAIEYLDKIGCATIASTIDDMELKLRALLDSEDMQLQNYNTSRQVFEDNHTRNQSNARVRRIVSRLVNNNRKE